MYCTRKEFLALSAAIVLSGCGSSRTSTADDADVEEVEEEKVEEEVEEEKPKEDKKDEENPEQIVDEPTAYDVIRCDYKEGVTGDVQVKTVNTTDFSGYYATLDPDGAFSFSVSGVDYTTNLTLGKETHHLYSGTENAKVTQLLFDGDKYITVGTVDIEGFYVDGYILLDMSTSVDGTFVDATYYLTKHIDE